MSDSNPALEPEAFCAWQQESRVIDELQVAFVVGPPKCGTTWVMQCLDGHPHAVARGESSVGRALVPRLRMAFDSFNAHQRKFSPHDVTRIGDRDFHMLLRQIIDRQLLQYAVDAPPEKHADLRAVIDKTPAHSEHIDLLASLYPTAKFICCTRDVRDGAVSGWFHYGGQGWLAQKSLPEYAQVYAVQTWGALLKAARTSAARLGAERYLEIDYADHTDDPHGQARRMLRFIGLPDDDESVQACADAGRFETATGGRQRGTEDRGSFYRKGVVSDWRSHFSEDEGDLILHLASEAIGEHALTVGA